MIKPFMIQSMCHELASYSPEMQSFRAKFFKLKSIAAPRTEMRGKRCQAQTHCGIFGLDLWHNGSSFVNVLQTVVLFI
jgi:hypothetical protein